MRIAQRGRPAVGGGAAVEVAHVHRRAVLAARALVVDDALGRRLSLLPERLRQARADLIRVGLIAYQRPLYQVLALDAPPSAAAVANKNAIEIRLGQLRTALLRQR